MPSEVPVNHNVADSQLMSTNDRKFPRDTIGTVLFGQEERQKCARRKKLYLNEQTACQ